MSIYRLKEKLEKLQKSNTDSDHLTYMLTKNAIHFVDSYVDGDDSIMLTTQGLANDLIDIGVDNKVATQFEQLCDFYVSNLLSSLESSNYYKCAGGEL